MEVSKTPIDSSAKQNSNNVRTNVIMNLIRTITMTVLSFITFPFVCRMFRDSGMGAYTWANTFVYYFVILAKISIPNIAIRECGKVKNDKKAFSHNVQLFFILQAIMTLISFAILCVLVACMWNYLSTPNTVLDGQNVNYTSLIFILSINFLVGVFSFEWVYIVLEKHFYITVRSIVSIALAAALTFAFITEAKTSIYIYATITILSTVITAICNCLVLPKYVSLKKEGKYDFKPFLKPLGVLFLISMALTAYNETDTLILGFIDSSKGAVGSYSVGVKGIDIIITIITSLYAVFMPRANHYYNMENKQFFRNLIRYSHNITFFIAIPAIATMATMSGPITALISGNYEVGGYNDANLVLVLLAIMMLTYSIADNVYTEILIPMKKEKIYLYTIAIGLVLNVALSIALGMAFNSMNGRPALGVAIGTGITDVLILVFLLWNTREYSKAAIFNKNNLKIVLFGIVIAALTFFVANANSPLASGGHSFFENMVIKNASDVELWLIYVLELVVMVFVDGIIFVGGLYLSKEKLVRSFAPGHKAEDPNA
ncbi:MAG: oligosaccharide flippase family protein [Bacilli bacterium]|nr:oligosaccharide flippase family protein [Bacilli bacterium]